MKMKLFGRHPQIQDFGYNRGSLFTRRPVFCPTASLACVSAPNSCYRRTIKIQVNICFSRSDCYLTLKEACVIYRLKSIQRFLFQQNFTFLFRNFAKDVTTIDNTSKKLYSDFIPYCPLATLGIKISLGSIFRQRITRIQQSSLL